MFAGAMIGLLIGTITGLVAILLVNTLERGGPHTVSSALAVTSELLAIPGCWFYAPWATGKILEIIGFPSREMVNPYLAALSIIFTLIICPSLLRLIMQNTRELKKNGN